MEQQACILIIDDDVEDQQILKEAFDTLPVPVRFLRFVDDGQNALSFLSQYQDANDLPRLIVLDLNMPKLSGVETLRVIKSNELLKSIPVIIFSSSFNPSDVSLSRKEGAVDYITKPSSFTQFREIAEKFASYCIE